MGPLAGLVDYAGNLFRREGMGFPIALISTSGFLYMLLKGSRKHLVFAAYPLVFISVSVVLNPGYASPRHQLPVYPFLAIAGGVLLTRWLPGSFTAKGRVLLLLLLVLPQPLFATVERGLQVSKRDTRNVAKEWIERHIPAGTKILLDETGPVLMQNESTLLDMMKKARRTDPKGQFTAHYDTYLQYQLAASKELITYDIQEIRLPWWRESFEKDGEEYLISERDRDFANPLRPVGAKSLQEYCADGVQFSILNGNRYDAFLREESSMAERYPSLHRLYIEISQEGDLIKEISPAHGRFAGPVIKIFRLRNCPEQF
jgi:hypothetical protein